MTEHQKGCCDEPKNHKYKCPYCNKESNDDNLLAKHMKDKHKGHIHFVIVKTFTQEGSP